MTYNEFEARRKADRKINRTMNPKEWKKIYVYWLEKLNGKSTK